MSSRRSWLTAVALLGAATAAPAQGVLDLIPEDAAAALGIRNLAELKEKGDKLFADAELDFPLRPSQLFNEGYKWLGLMAGVAEDRPTTVILASPKSTGAARGDSLEQLVVAVPYTDLDTIAGNFNLKAEDLKAGKVASVEGRLFGGLFMAHNRHLFIGHNEKALRSVAQGRGVGKGLSADLRRRFGGADVLLHLGTEAWGDEWTRFLKQAEVRLAGQDGEADRKLAGQLVESLKAVRLILGATRVGDGVGVSLLAVLPKEGNEAARKVLSDLQGGPGASDLAGLPDGQAVFAQAARGDGGQNARFMKLLADFLLRDLLVAGPWLPSPKDRPNIVAVFGEVWKHLKGHRVAVYRNADEPKMGLFSVVAILDTDDGEKFLATMKGLARLADSANPSGKGVRQDHVAEVAKLIRDLGDDAYEVRESASTRLALVGEPALPYVEKALSSDDVEVRRRAADLKERIVTAAAARRQELLSKDTPWRIRPTFTFVGTERRDGRPVETLRVKLTKKDASAAVPLRQLFGPDWDKVRLAVHGKQVVVLLGSDERLLQVARQNLEGGKPGLAASKPLEAFARQADPGRKIELHASVGTLLALVKAEDLRLGQRVVGRPSLSSLALTVGPERLQLDLRVPVAEIKAVARAQKR
jgi:hypothetical protein